MILPDVQQLRDWDAATIAAENISSLDLMERAAQACTQWIVDHYQPGQKVTIVCGRGNNGGDGLAIARQLYEQGFTPTVFVADWDNNGSNDFIKNLERLQQSGASISFIQSEKDFPLPDKNELLIEALFGFGLTRKLEGLYASLIDHLNRENAFVVSIDVPAGMYIDATSEGNTMIKASVTLTFQTLKRCFLMPENAEFFGDVIVLPIGLNEDFATTLNNQFRLTDLSTVARFYKPRKQFSHKGTYGHALLVAGNEGKMGAAVMCASACLRAGAGLLTCSLLPEHFAIIHTTLPEAMTANRYSLTDFSPYAAVGIGPGLGKEEQTASILQTLLQHYKKPMVIDADAINILSEHKDWLTQIPKHSILTPHPKEFQRLFGESKNDFERVSQAVDAAAQYNIVIVLKGTFTLVTDGKRNYFNSTGNNGMATGGSGDVLTGLITGLLAQQYEPFEAAVTGVYVHGLSADLCLQEQSYESLLPMDMVYRFGAAFKQLQNNKGA